MATATRKRVASAPVEDVSETEAVEAESNGSSTPKVKRTRRMPTAVFEIAEVGEALPENPKRKGGGGGGGKSKWLKVLQRIADEAPVGAWVRVQNFPASNGATTAKRNMRKGLEEGKVTFPVIEGVGWEVESRREAKEDGSGNSSALFIRKVEDVNGGDNLTGTTDADDGEDENED